MSHSVFIGDIRHRRFTPKKHGFNYGLYMFGFDVDEIMQTDTSIGVFGFSKYYPLSFIEQDYIKSEPGNLKQRIKEKVTSLGGCKNISRITMLVQVRCFGFYFSPANFYFCYDSQGKCHQVLVEVSNTPWNERHYYLIDLAGEKVNKKQFHVSPFMTLAMKYHWKIRAPSEDSNHLTIAIENRISEGQEINKKLFDVCMKLNKNEFNRRQLTKLVFSYPVMTVKIVSAIYYQALKLFLKRVPFVRYQHSNHS